MAQQAPQTSRPTNKPKVIPYTEVSKPSSSLNGTSVNGTSANSASMNGASMNGASMNGNGQHATVTTSTTPTRDQTGKRIPIPMMSPDNMPTFDPDSEMGKRMGAVNAMMPDVMADTPEELEQAKQVQQQIQAEPELTIEQQVQSARSKSLRMQFRFWYTVFFAVWLFGRAIFWQVYVSKVFPRWVERTGTKRFTKYAKEFRKFAIRMGGVMIKAGQFASTRADVLPEEVIAELAGLQDKVPTIPFKKIRKVLERELGDLDSRYEWITEEPVAAASLGQVHRAQLKGEDGDRVVVKIQRPKVRDLINTDMAALFIVARLAMRFSFIRKRADMIQLSEEFGRVLLEEVSYEKEAENAKRFQNMFADDAGVYVPHIYTEHSSDFILTIEDVTSLKVDDYEALAHAGINRKDVAQRMMDTYMQQIFSDRFFHADPHPGNLFVYPLPVSPEEEAQYVQAGGGRPFYLIFIDFGMTGSLTPEIVQGLINTLTAVITRDSNKLVDSYVELGFLLPNADLYRIKEATSTVFDTVWGMSMVDMATMDFEVIQNIGTEFNDLLYDLPFRVPQDFVYLGRTVAILTGMATKLDPNYNPWTEIQYYMQELITTNEDGNIFDELTKTLQDSLDEIITGGPQGFIRVAERIYEQFRRASRTEQLLQQIVNGDVQVETRLSSQHRFQLERIEAQSRRTTRTVMSGALLISAVMLHTNGDSELAIISLAGASAMYASMWFMRV